MDRTVVDLRGVHKPVSVKGLAYDIFGSLWGVLELAALTASGSLRGVSLEGFVAARRAEVDGILESVRAVGDFSADTMSVFERQIGRAHV